MEDALQIDLAIDRLTAAYRSSGLPPIRRPRRVTRLINEVREAIAPLQLPAELITFWERVDPASLIAAPLPAPSDLGAALESWLALRDELPGMTPRLMMPICYEQHSFVLIELETGVGNGGSCFTWSYGDARYTLAFTSLAAYLDLLATMVELREFDVHHTRSHTQYTFDPDNRWADAQAVRLAAGPLAFGLRGRREVLTDVRSWPEHWLAAEGLTTEVRAPRGANTSIAELLDAARSGRPAAGTVRATVRRLSGSRHGDRAEIDDGTATLDLWCPSAVCADGPVEQQEFEFDIVMPAQKSIELDPDVRLAPPEAIAIRPLT